MLEHDNKEYCFSCENRTLTKCLYYTKRAMASMCNIHDNSRLRIDGRKDENSK